MSYTEKQPSTSSASQAPTGVAILEPACIAAQTTPQFEAFKCRVIANLHAAHLGSSTLQYFIERPQMIIPALKAGFDTSLVRHEDDARKTLEKFIWETPAGENAYDRDDIIKSKKLLVWLFRQSNGLTEEVALHSPFDPIDQTEEIIRFARVASLVINMLQSSNAPCVSFDIIMKGVGCPLHLGTGASNKVGHFLLTLNHYDERKAHRLFWHDAVKGMETIEQK